jgi:DNA (cytosine-5)-methyltransferase 1
MLDIHGFKDDRGGRFIPQALTATNKLDWWYRDSRLGGVCNHETRSHMSKDIWRYLFAACFTKVQKFPPKLRNLDKFNIALKN